MPKVLALNAIRVAGPTRVAVRQFLVPAGAVVLGAMLLGEAGGPPRLVGSAIVVAGLAPTRRVSCRPVHVRSPLDSGS